MKNERKQSHIDTEWNPNLPLLFKAYNLKRKRRSKPNPLEKEKTKRRFCEVRLGYVLKLKAPLEYDMILQASTRRWAPEVNLIEAISYTSLNPFFRTKEFRELLIMYRKNGCYQDVPEEPPSPELLRQSLKERLSLLQG